MLRYRQGVLVLFLLLYPVASNIEAFLSDISLSHVQVEPEMILHFLTSNLDFLLTAITHIPLRQHRLFYRRFLLILDVDNLGRGNGL